MVKVIFLKILLRMVTVTLAGVVLERVVAVHKGMVAEGEEVLDARTILLLVKLMPFLLPDTFLSRISSENLMPLTFSKPGMCPTLPFLCSLSRTKDPLARMVIQMLMVAMMPLRTLLLVAKDPSIPLSLRKVRHQWTVI